ncbi:MAG: glycoside hydrolase family 2 protein [Eubacteriales bacterium]
MNSHQKLFLNGTWKLAYAPNSRVLDDNYNLNTVLSIKASGYHSVDAVVPGNFELDLQRSGIIGDPYYSTNTLELQKLECMHLYYYNEFYYTGNLNELYLHFEGIDTISDIYVNGCFIASTNNMFIAYEYRLNCLHDGINEIVVHIKPAAIETRRIDIPPSSNALPYNYDSLYIRKAGSMFGWDIMPRIVSGGIWRDVYIEKKPKERIENVFVYTRSINTGNNSAEIIFHYNLKIYGDFIGDYSVKASGRCGDSSFESKNRLWFTSGKLGAWIGNCKLWFPRNYGNPNLYDTVFELYKGDELLDSYNLRFGVRTVELDRTSATDRDGNGEFCIKINGKRIFAMGTNWVPVDAFHSNDVKRIPEITPMLNDLNCNIVRLWGGNVYEHESFYDFCDENGIMIWQDFAMGCAVYPQEKQFLDILESEIISIVKKYRNHSSLVIWAGDNECDYAYMSWGGITRDPNDNIITRRLIPETLRTHDFTRPYLPSSPYIDHEAYKSKKPLSEEHLWGPRDYFKGDFYKNSVCHFASETGYHGCPSPESLRKFIAPEKLWHWFDKEQNRSNDDWLTHAASMELNGNSAYSYRIKLMSDQVITLFGHEPETLDDFSLASQISQAEAKKYFIERFRISKWRRTGIIWWNLIDGWPQISDAVVDYYYDKKLAYYYIKRSQQPLCIMFDEPDNGQLKLFAVNDTQNDEIVSYKITDITMGEVIRVDKITAAADSSRCIWDKPYENGEQHFYLIEWSYNRSAGRNHYMTGLKNINLDEYRSAMKKCGFEVK